MKSPLRTAFQHLLSFAATLFVVGAVATTTAIAQSYKVTNILSDGSVPAKTTDTSFINPWGVSLGKTFWTNSARGGYDALNDINGAVAFKVTVPGSTAGSQGAPTGTVTQPNSSAFLLPNEKSGSFLFCTLGGTVSGWNGGLGTAGSIAVNMIDHSAQKAAYTGMALVTNDRGTYLLLANFGGTGIEVFDSTWNPATLAGTFTDPNLPAGYFPFNVHTLGTQVFVTYIQKDSNGRELLQAGNGIVDVFDVNGNFVSRAVTGGNLNSPWGIAKAPANYGIYANALLVGNFGDGIINVYDPATFAYLGQITDGTGTAIAFAGLWEILVGGGTAGSSNGDANVLYFAAGIGGQAHGLFGQIDTTGTGAPTFGFSTSTSTLSVLDGKSGTLTVAMEPTNGFNGPVTLTCSGLPVGAVCNFTQPTVSVGANASATTNLSITTSKSSASLRPLLRGNGSGIVAAFGVPFLGLLFFRRRLPIAGLSYKLTLPVVLLTSLTFVCLSGCGDSAPNTPVGASTVHIQAVSGSLTQSANVSLTVQ